MNNQSHNRYLERLDQLEAARKLWDQSEYVLSFLRLRTGKTLPELTEEEILTWYRTNNPQAFTIS